MNFSQKIPGEGSDLCARAGIVSSPAPGQCLEQLAGHPLAWVASSGLGLAAHTPEEGCLGLHRSMAQSSLWA